MQKIQKVMLALSVIGLVTAVYLVLVHYTEIPLACSTSGLINCNSVLNSTYGYLLGIPVAIYGVVFFIVEIVILLLTFEGKTSIVALGRDIRILYNTVGLVFVFYLLYAEYSVGHICEYCTVVHIVTVLLFVLSFIRINKKPNYYSTPNPY